MQTHAHTRTHTYAESDAVISNKDVPAMDQPSLLQRTIQVWTQCEPTINEEPIAEPEKDDEYVYQTKVLRADLADQALEKWSLFFMKP